ncbi:MAG TPA: hypothetical protein VGH42_12070 [Verrucomicrobiae bacterium]|jgi:hypothetical protein
MNVSASTFAEPFTPRGVAAFAHAKFGRLLLVQFIFALLAAAAAVWFLDDACFPIIRAAIQKLPDAGKISSGKLDWRGDSPQMLAEGNFMAFDIDLNHSGQIHPTTADVQVEFGAESVRVFSWLGYAEFFYPPDRAAPFNRTELEPLWGAWSAEILFIAAAATTTGLLLSWCILATIYFLPVWILGFFANRDLNFRASWKLSGAALMPGALLMAAGILLYDFGFLNLVSFGFVFAAHFVLGWIYLFVSLLFLPSISKTPERRNPFKQAKA